MRHLIPLPVPASIYGLLLLLLALLTGLLRPESVKEISKFLIEIMPVLFIPASVGLLDALESLRAVLIPVFLVSVVSTVLVMGVSGRVTQALIRKKGGKRG